MSTQTVNWTVTIPNPTSAQIEAINNILATGTTGKKSKPAKTVSDDEDEEFATKGAVDEEELASDDGAEEEESTDEDEEETLSWDTVKEAINTYGEKKPEDMKAILLSFNFKGTKELKANPKKWEPVYRKTMQKIKIMKAKTKTK